MESSYSQAIKEIEKMLSIETLDFEAQWKTVLDLLDSYHEQKLKIFKYLMVDYRGYIEIRYRAGLEYYTQDPESGWGLINGLIKSKDADDRDTALYILRRIGATRSKQFIMCLLEDEWPYIRLEAADILKFDHPDIVLDSIRLLFDHDQEWVRNEARRISDEIIVDEA
jgi:hypothetical protein